MPSLKELREKAGKVHETMVQLRDRYNQRKTEKKVGSELWPKEEREAWEAANAEHDSLRAQIAEEKRSEDLDAAIADMERESRDNRATPPGDRKPPGEHRNRPGQDERRETPQTFEQRQLAEVETRDLALQAWFGRGQEACRSEQHLQAAQHCGIDLSANELHLDLYDTRQLAIAQYDARSMHPKNFERRALSGHLGQGGAFTIGSTLVSSIEVNMLAFGGVSQVADTMVTQTGEEVSWPTADDTGNEGEMLGENTATATDEDPSFAAVRWNAYEFSSKAVLVPVRLLEDAPTTFAQTLGEMLGERLGRAKNRKFTTGTGVGQPKGIITCASRGKLAASATAILADEIIELQHSVDPAYRDQPGSGFMAHDSILLQIRLLKDGTGVYIWQSGLIQDMPDRLLNKPVTPNQHMDSALTASNKVLLYGALRKYKIRRVRQVRILRLRERYAEKAQEAFLAFERADGNMLDAGTGPVKYLQMKA